MEYRSTFLPKSEIAILITVPFVEFEPHLKKAAVLISEEIEIEGFRKGKAPYDMVKNRVGEMKVYERAADLAVRKTYPEVLKELITSKKLSEEYPPIGRPEITVTKLALGNELEYKVKLALLPEVKLPDYKKIARRIRIKKKAVSVEDQEIEHALNWIRDSRVKLVIVGRAAEKGDRVEVDFEISQGGVKIKEGDSRNHPLILGQNKFMPGFEDELAGMRTGEEKSFTLVSPENWHEKGLAGKVLEFKTVMKLVQERILPELTDDFAKGLGDFSSLEGLRSNIREGIRQEKEEKEKQRIRAETIEEIAREAALEIPDVLTEAELAKIIQEFKTGVEGMGMKFEDYLSHINKSFEDLKKEWGGEAEKRARIALCLGEIAKNEKIEPSEEEIGTRVNDFLREFRSAKEAENKIDPKKLREYTMGIVRNEKAFEFLEKV